MDSKSQADLRQKLLHQQAVLAQADEIQVHLRQKLLHQQAVLAQADEIQVHLRQLRESKEGLERTCSLGSEKQDLLRLFFENPRNQNGVHSIVHERYHRRLWEVCRAAYLAELSVVRTELEDKYTNLEVP